MLSSIISILFSPDVTVTLELVSSFVPITVISFGLSLSIKMPLSVSVVEITVALLLETTYVSYTVLLLVFYKLIAYDVALFVSADSVPLSLNVTLPPVSAVKLSYKLP